MVYDDLLEVRCFTLESSKKVTRKEGGSLMMTPHFFIPEKLYMAENLAPSASWHLFFNFSAKHGLAFKNFWVMMPI